MLKQLYGGLSSQIAGMQERQRNYWLQAASHYGKQSPLTTQG